MIPIALKPEYIGSVLGVPITNTFFTSVLVVVLLVVFVSLFRSHSSSRVTTLAKVVVLELLRLVDSVTRDRTLSKVVLPLILSFFVFICCANLLALIPGFLGSLFVATPEGAVPLLRSPNSDLTTTLALALISVVAIQYFSLRALGVGQFVKRFINFANPVSFILGFFELLAEAMKILSFSFRLFGNVFAGEVLLIVVAFLVPYLLPVPFMLLEVFVGVIQAFIFSVLTTTFIRTSTMSHIRDRARITH